MRQLYEDKISTGRKDWIENRLRELAGIFQISVCGFSLMDSHLHVLLRLDRPPTDGEWSDEEVVRRWAKLFPPRDKPTGKVLKVSAAWVAERRTDAAWVAKVRSINFTK